MSAEELDAATELTVRVVIIKLSHPVPVAAIVSVKVPPVVCHSPSSNIESPAHMEAWVFVVIEVETVMVMVAESEHVPVLPTA